MSDCGNTTPRELLNDSIEVASTLGKGSGLALTPRFTTTSLIQYPAAVLAVAIAVAVHQQLAHAGIHSQYGTLVGCDFIGNADPQAGVLFRNCGALQQLCARYGQPLVEDLVGFERDHDPLAANQTRNFQHVIERAFTRLDVTDQGAQTQPARDFRAGGCFSQCFRRLLGGDNSLQGDLETRLSLPVAELREVDSVERHRVQLARGFPERLDIPPGASPHPPQDRVQFWALL